MVWSTGVGEGNIRETQQAVLLGVEPLRPKPGSRKIIAFKEVFGDPDRVASASYYGKFGC